MKYRICVRPYGRDASAHSNKPKCWTFNLKDDKEALFVACAMDYYTGQMIPSKEEKYRKYSEEDLEAILEDYNINNPFVFYIENAEEDYFVFDSGEDPEEYDGMVEEDLEEDYDDF